MTKLLTTVGIGFSVIFLGACMTLAAIESANAHGGSMEWFLGVVVVGSICLSFLVSVITHLSSDHA